MIINEIVLLWQCDMTVAVVYRCVICVSNQPKYLVVYDRYEKTVKGVLLSFLKFFPIKTIIRTGNFLFHEHFKDINIL